MFQSFLGHVVFLGGVCLVTLAGHLIGDIPTALWQTIDTDHMALAFLGFVLAMFGSVMVATASRD